MNRQHREDTLDSLMQVFHITDLERGLPPISEEERMVVRIQLIAAKIIVDDLIKIEELNSKESPEDIINKLSQNWYENIKNFAFAIESSRK